MVLQIQLVLCWEYLFQIIPVSDKYPLRYWKYWGEGKLVQIN